MPPHPEWEKLHVSGSIRDRNLKEMKVHGSHYGEIHWNGDGARNITAYLCDSKEVFQWMRGEIDGQEGTLQVDDTKLEVTISEDQVSGVVAFGEGEPMAFSAEQAAEGAGIYRGELTQGDSSIQLGWLVLNDGRQRGGLDGKGNDIIVVDPN